MKLRILFIILMSFLLVLAVISLASAFEEGVYFRRNISKTFSTLSEKAGLAVMNFYVPAQTASGEVTSTLIYSYTDGISMTRSHVKPLLTTYIDGVMDDVFIDEEYVVGYRDAFIALSLDDGSSWKLTNLSNSALESSFTLDIGDEFPGDAYATVLSVAGDRAMVAWLSRYCTGGNPAYAMVDELNNPIYPDYFGVSGEQGSVNYTAQGFPEIGEIAYGCVWAARGQLLYSEGDPLVTGDEKYDITWTKAERLTSGRRDPNRLEIASVNETGFVLAWQEDPSGLRPGNSLGPGEGWSGAIVNSKTDIWYSYIGWDEFDNVYASDTVTEVVDISVYTGTVRPGVAFPMAMPVRLTDNNMCQIAGDAAGVDQYCFTDFSTDPPTIYTKDDIPAQRLNMTFCNDTVYWTPPLGGVKEVCATEDGRVLMGRIGASRPRIALHPYTKSDGEKSAWVVLGYEESKALGEGSSEDILVPTDIGKNMWYQSFDMFEPDIISHGNILNQPAADPISGSFYPIQSSTGIINFTTGIYGGLDYNFDFYETDISRRFSLISQNIEQVGPSGLIALPLVKTGIINSGGPGDIFARRIVIPAGFDPSVDNPYSFENMVCDQWAYDDGSNPYYPKGICLDPLTNLSGTSTVFCNMTEPCPTIADVYKYDSVTDDWYWDLTAFERVTEWIQTEGNLDDQNWDNPFDVAKGHRGFLDGDFIMILYAWSPNYNLNLTGNDHYNLYVRRSFDGGASWTTLPASYVHTDQIEYVGDGTNTCENYGWGTGYVYQVCNEYDPGEFEQARNVSHLIGKTDTILDPRYSPVKGVTTQCMNQGVLEACPEGSGLPYIDDAQREPSYYFLLYETGDNTTVINGEATPENMYYTRASHWGDDYDVQLYYNELFTVTVETWDWLENGPDESVEASLTSNASGTFAYATWSQQRYDDEILHEYTDMDIYFRRLMYTMPVGLRPTASILSISPEELIEGEPISLEGEAYDQDEIGEPPDIIAYEWSQTPYGESTRSVVGISETLVISLPAGIHTIGFRGQDNEGMWSPFDMVEIEVIPAYDKIPLASIISISSTTPIEGDLVTIVGEGEDQDHLGDPPEIRAYEWTDTMDSTTTVVGDEATEEITLSAGIHTIGFRVQDNDDTWSEYDHWVIEVLPKPTYEIYLPLLIHTNSEADALTQVQEETTLIGNLDVMTATFPTEIPAVLVDLPYQINSRMTLDDPLPEGTTVSISITVNGAGPAPYVTGALVPGTTFWVTELFDPEPTPADFDANYGGRVEVYNITIHSGGGNLEPINTNVTVESIISKDSFATQVILADIVIPISIPIDEEAAALVQVQDETTLIGNLDVMTATFPAEIPAILVDLPYQINSRMTLADPLPEGTTVSISITVDGAGPAPYVTGALVPGTTFWITELFDPEPTPADFDANYGGRVEVYNITIHSGGGNLEPINTNVTVESIISKDSFATKVILADIVIPISIPADEEAAALAQVQDETTLIGNLDVLTATFPAEIPAMLVDLPYQINSRMTLADPLPEGTTVSISITVNGAGPAPYVTGAPIPGTTFWITELFDPEPTPADFDANYGGRVEVYNITIHSGGGNPEFINTNVTVESIISKDSFATEVILADIIIPISIPADEEATLVNLRMAANLSALPNHPSCLMYIL